MLQKGLDLAAEVLTLAAAVLLLIPALRVSSALAGVYKTKSGLASIKTDLGIQRIAAAWASTMESIITRWRPLDHRCLVLGLAAQALASVVKVVRIFL